jgi:hypothetical protein
LWLVEQESDDLGSGLSSAPAQCLPQLQSTFDGIGFIFRCNLAVPSLARSRLPLSEGTRSCGIAEIRCLRMLTTGSFPLALAFFSLAFLDRASAKASVLLRAMSRRRFAHQNRHRLIQRFGACFLRCHVAGPSVSGPHHGSPALLYWLGCSPGSSRASVYRLLSGSYTLFQS